MSTKKFTNLTKFTLIKFLLSGLMRGTANLVTTISTFNSLFKAPDQTFILSQPNTTWKYSVITANADLVNELEDDSRFDKYIFNSAELLLGDSVGSVWSHEDVWLPSNRIISSGLAGQHLKKYLPAINVVSANLCAKLRYGYASNEYILVGDEVSKAIWDISGLVTLSENFGALFKTNNPELMQTYLDSLLMAIQYGNEPKFIKGLRFIRNRKMNANLTKIRSYNKEKIANRLADDRKGDYQDFLSFMLEMSDPISGKRISNASIENQIVALIVGINDTTRLATEWILYYLCMDRDLLIKAYAEVDSLFPDPNEQITSEKINQLDLLPRIFKEAQRICPSVSVIMRYALEDTEVLDGISVKKGTLFYLPLYAIHNNSKYWKNPSKFDPDRFLPEAEAQIKSGSYHPFGVAKRSCIGRGFAFVEVMTILVSLLRNFDLRLDPKYKLITESITAGAHPKDLKISFKFRSLGQNTGSRTTAGNNGVNDLGVPSNKQVDHQKCPFSATTEQSKPIASNLGGIDIAYGSNGGFGKSVARIVAQQARGYGFIPNIYELNDLPDRLQKNHKLLIITSTYNSSPPINAQRFVDLLKKGNLDFAGIDCAIIGLGDVTWQSSFMSIPLTVEKKVIAHGGNLMLPMLKLDVSNDDHQAFLDKWLIQFWGSSGVDVSASLQSQASYTISAIGQSPMISQFANMKYFKVLQNKELIQDEHAASEDRSTRLISFSIPPEFRYQAGDYVYILAYNSRPKIAKALRAFGLNSEDLISIDSDDSQSSWLPINSPISYWDLFMRYIDLNKTLTRSDFKFIESHLDGRLKQSAKKVLDLPDSAFNEKIRDKKVNLIDFLESIDYPAFPFAYALNILHPLKRRYYSISSSPLVSPQELSITVGVLKNPHSSGKGIFRGICSNYLESLNPGDFIRVGILESHFRLPEDASTPMIWVGAGTGIAPYRSFIQSRSALQAQGQQLGKCILIAGCRKPGYDQLYAQEWLEAERKGLIKVYWAFSRNIVDGALHKTYVQDVIESNKAELTELINAGANVYVCGDGETIGKSIPIAFGEELFTRLRAENRVYEDIWGGNK
jgi:cytochrome P450 / NADPH-cytochrome P450 reductase